MPRSNGDIQPCPEQDSTTIPTTLPLRIFKRRLPTVPEASSTSFVKSSAPPYAIPRRHSSYAIRRPLRLSREPQYSTLPVKQDSPRSSKSHNIERHSLFDSRLLSLRTFSNNRPSMDEELNERSRSGVDNVVRRIPSKGGIFPRVAKVLDFSKSRHSSLGPASGGYSRLDPPKRVYTEPNSPNTHRYPPNHKIREPISTQLTAAPERFGQRTPPFTRKNLFVPKHRNNVHTRFSCPLPITRANIHITMDAMKISAREDLFTWAAVEISANVNLEGELETQIGCDVPLDIIVLLDNSASMPPALLKGACNTVLHLASSMDMLVDRMAIGCISADPEQNLQLLLPLSTCNLDVIRGLLRSVQIFQFPCDEPNLTRTSKALHEASNLLLRYSSRGALRHVFVITANLGISLLEITSNIRSRVRFHTISPEPVLVVWASEPVDGWHLSASFDEEDNDGAHALKHNLKQVMRHLRFGLDPGVLSNLSIRLDGQHGCDIEAILGETKCKALRPGEKWTLLVKIKAVSEVMEELSVHGDRTQNPVDNDVDQMIDQLHGLLRASDRAISENIFTVNLEHSHSALSGPAVIKLENKCEITRFPRKKVRQALHKDVRELYGEGNALQGRVKRINSMHLSRHLDGGDNHRTSEQGKNSRERSFTSSPSHLSQHLEVYNSPQVELGSMNPFRNLVEGCDGNCFHNICSDEKVARDQAFVSPIS
ncbi:hypothetical protein BDBG_03062 [Blastomyces gilchristii SLH14081]|uniref:VWFA domain-containing protein n=1 Tax=Blastomyces gilchristii (strain SLH14081) TaxID=559298 RepID=A0A179UIG4_BLAGS|nr:uncharacterized protein BDBG_03062 [Blastomyces gilchristii SLH14081]OAT06927.1 hypothetical protein BDBG_03062 [Blastomyces gilchristii SLH14081]